MSAAASKTEPAPQPALVRLSPLLVTLFPGADPVVELAARTVADVVDGLDARWPGMRDRICDSTPRDPPPHERVRGRPPR